MAPDQTLQGMRILLVDDEYLIAVTIEEMLQDAGAVVVTASTLPEALKSATGENLSAALLDVRLGRDTTESVADTLAKRAIPFVFYSGQTLPDHIRSKHPNARVLIKPVKQDMFVETIRKILKYPETVRASKRSDRRSS